MERIKYRGRHKDRGLSASGGIGCLTVPPYDVRWNFLYSFRYRGVM